MSSIAARRANKRVCPLQPNGILSRGTHGILAQMPCRPRATDRGLPQRTSASGAAWRSQRWPPDGGGWPCAAWVMGRRRRWGCGGGTNSNAMSLLKNAMSLLLKRLIQKRLQPWRRSGGAAAEMGAHDGTARTSERRVHTRAGMEHGARGEGEGLLHHGSSGTRWGCAQDTG